MMVRGWGSGSWSLSCARARARRAPAQVRCGGGACAARACAGARARMGGAHAHATLSLAGGAWAHGARGAALALWRAPRMRARRGRAARSRQRAAYVLSRWARRKCTPAECGTFHLPPSLQTPRLLANCGRPRARVCRTGGLPPPEVMARHYAGLHSSALYQPAQAPRKPTSVRSHV